MENKIIVCFEKKENVYYFKYLVIDYETEEEYYKELDHVYFTSKEYIEEIKILFEKHFDLLQKAANDKDLLGYYLNNKLDNQRQIKNTKARIARVEKKIITKELYGLYRIYKNLEPEFGNGALMKTFRRNRILK